MRRSGKNRRRFRRWVYHMKCREIIEKLEQLYPPKFAASWDNPGLQVGDREKEIQTVYLALDATDEVIEHAIQEKTDLLITHHPMIFSGLKSVTAEHFIGRRVMRMIQSGMCYYAIHTNYDVAKMAELSADYLELKDTKILSVSYCEGETGIQEGYGRVGDLAEEMTLEQCADAVKRAFSLREVKVFGDPCQKIRRAAILPGSGKSMILDALKSKADVMITGDIDHHAGIDAVAQGLAIIDAGHYGTEHIFMEQMRKELEQDFPELTVKREAFAVPFRMM